MPPSPRRISRAVSQELESFHLIQRGCFLSWMSSFVRQHPRPHGLAPHNPREADSQSTLIKTRIANHQNSSPTSMLTAVDQLTKGTIAVIHQVALLQAEVSSLRKANEALSKRRRAKKTRMRLGGSLAVQDAKDQLAEKAGVGEVTQEKEQDSSSVGGVRTKVRCYSVCGKPGHNARTCQEAGESSDSAASNVIIVGS